MTTMNYTLKHWQIVFVKEKEGKRKYIAYGLVYHHPKFPPGYDIHTSYIEQVELGDECLLIKTMNSVYELPLCDYNLNSRDDSFWDDPLLWKQMPDTEDITRIKEKMLTLAREERLRARQEQEIKLEDEAECFVMMFDGNDSCYFKDAFVKGIAPDKIPYIHHFEPFVHVGNYQDSVLLNFEPEENLDLYGGGSRKAYELSINDFDFRFFPYFGNHIEFYFWGKYAGKIYFINQGQHPLRVKTPCGEFMLPADQKAYRIKPDANAPWYEKY